MFNLGPTMKVVVIDTPTHYHPQHEPFQIWQEEIMGKVITVQEYVDDEDEDDDEQYYHITNCPENDALGFFPTRSAYQRKYMCLLKKYFAPIVDNHSAKAVLNKI